MISFRVDSYRFHYRAAAIIVDSDYVLLHRLQGDSFWALPGGRVNAGESAQVTIAREFREELGSEVLCGDLACTGENFFEWQGQAHHEIGLYFNATLPEYSVLSDKGKIHIGVEGDKTLDFKWFHRQELPTIDMRPIALRIGLSSGPLPGHFIQKDISGAA